MKKTRIITKILSAFMAVLMCSSCFAIFTVAAGTPSLAIADVSAKGGDLVSVSVFVANNPGVASMAVRLDYDTDLMTPVSVKNGEALGGRSLTSNIDSVLNPADLTYLTAFFMGSSNVKRNGEFFVFTFRLSSKVNVDEIDLYVSCSDACNQALEDVSFSSAYGKLTVDKADDEEIGSDDNVASDVEVQIKRGAKNIKYMAGYSDGTFKPEQYATRYEVVEAFDLLFDVIGKIDMSLSFKDVDSAHNAMVRRFASAKVLNGYPSDNTFRGQKTISRAEFCKIVCVLLEIDTSKVKDQGFTDLKTKGSKDPHWATAYINACAKEGIVLGKEKDGVKYFSPDAPIKRCEVVTMINRITGAKGGTTCAYSDVPSGAWYFEAVASAAK